MSFTLVPSLVGGLMLSCSTSFMLAFYGRILGISGIAHSVVGHSISCLTRNSISDTSGNRAVSSTAHGDGNSIKSRRKAAENSKDLHGEEIVSKNGWKWSAFMGLLVGGGILGQSQHWIVSSFVGAPIFDSSSLHLSLWRTLLAGFLVGFGTKLGAGCTSGHMLCGLSRFSRRSIAATLTFFPVAGLTAQFFPIPLSSVLLAKSPVSSVSPTLGSSIAVVSALQLPALLYMVLIPRVLDRKHKFSPDSKSPISLSTNLSSFFVGMHFSFGLALAGMTRPTKVISFFYVPLSFLPLTSSRVWDPSLAMVAIGGLLPNIFAWRAVKGWSRPFKNDSWELPSRKNIDSKMILGNVLFGVGWGLAGLCPGPMLAGLGASSLPAVVVPFFLAFCVGGQVGSLSV